jgi:hypothetical protein
LEISLKPTVAVTVRAPNTRLQPLAGLAAAAPWAYTLQVLPPWVGKETQEVMVEIHLLGRTAPAVAVVLAEKVPMPFPIVSRVTGAQASLRRSREQPSTTAAAVVVAFTVVSTEPAG